MIHFPARFALVVAFVACLAPAVVALRASTSIASHSHSHSHSQKPERATRTSMKTEKHDYSSEVVGANGRIGTFWLEKQPPTSSSSSSLSSSSSPSSLRLPAIPCPRGTTPGSQTPAGTPIYVATPSDAYPEIYEATPETRRGDLVFVGNAGLPIDDRFAESTILVPHFSVLYKNQWKSKSSDTTTTTTTTTTNDDDDDDDNNNTSNSYSYSYSYSTRSEIQINTDPATSPPTYVYGRHAATAAAVLEANGIRTQIVESFPAIRAYSGRKLIWASCLWLLCHNHNHNHHSLLPEKTDRSGEQPDRASPPPPLTVGQVHELRQDDLDRLVDELLPSLRALLISVEESGGNERDPTNTIIDRDEVRDYLRAYSTSIPRAIPSVDLAKQEFHDRNGVWLSMSKNAGASTSQPFHVELLRRQGVDVDGSETQ